MPAPVTVSRWRPRLPGLGVAFWALLGTGAEAQSREWQSLKPGTLLRVQTRSQRDVWQFDFLDTTRLALVGPCAPKEGSTKHECVSGRVVRNLTDVRGVARQSDRTVQGALIGGGIGLSVGLLLGLLAPNVDNRGAFTALTVTLFTVPGVVIGVVKGSATKRWVELPPPWPPRGS